MQLTENTTFANRYHLLRLLGRGGFSEVWLAKDSLTDLEIALKVYAPGTGMDEDGLKIFSKELAAVYNLNHNNLLKPQHVDSWQGMPYLVMSYCSQGSLVKRIGKMTEEEIWKVLYDVASGLAYLHERDIVHQDIKPDNILVDNAGNYVITDFGISTRVKNTLRKSVSTSSANSGGTIAYMGPERFGKEPTPIKASDIWSLGAMLFELMTGETPFGEHGGLIQKSGAEIPAIHGDYSDRLKSAVEKMLSQETWDRPTAAQLAKGESTQSVITSSSCDGTEKEKQMVYNGRSTDEEVSKERKKWTWVVLILMIIVGGEALFHNIQEKRQRERIAMEQRMAEEQAERERIAAENIRLAKEKEERDCLEAEKKAKELEEAQRIAAEKKAASKGYNNGHEWVDLGLSVKWATCNVGATIPEGYGDYFAWGETSPKKSVLWESYKYGNARQEGVTKYYLTDNKRNGDGKIVLEAMDDAASVNWGATWRTPTIDEWRELENRCTLERVCINGIYGFRVRSKNGKSIFLPCAGGPHINERESGFYWSASLKLNAPYGSSWHAQLFRVDYCPGSVQYSYMCTDGERSVPFSVRPVLP